MTVTAPIIESQINNAFFVSPGAFATIQAAIDYARTLNGGIGQIIIGQGATTNENIAMLTGGTPNIYLTDQRNGAAQTYVWTGGQFVAGDLNTGGALVTTGVTHFTPPGSATLDFNPAGTSGSGTSNLLVTGVPGKTMPSFTVQMQLGDMTGNWTWLRFDTDPNGNPRILMPEMLELLNHVAGTPNLWVGDAFNTAGSKGMTVYGNPTQNSIDLQGETVGGAFDQTVRLNPLGGTVQLGMNASVNAAGGLTAAALTAPTAHITGDATVDGLLKGMKKIRAYGFMPIDLTAAHVSIGTSNGGTIPITSFTDTAAPVNQRIWSIAALTDQMWFTCDDDNGTNYPWMTVTRNGHNATGITLAAPLTLPGDPTLPAQAATKNYVDDAIAESGNFVYPSAGITVSTGSAWGTPIDPATLLRYPAAGIALSTGSAWGTPINPANVAMLDAARNSFSGSMSIQGATNVGNPIGSTGWVFGVYTPSGPASFGMQSGDFTWAILSASSMGSPGFIWDANHDMTFATSTQSSGLGYNPLLTIKKTGDAALNGSFQCDALYAYVGLNSSLPNNGKATIRVYANGGITVNPPSGDLLLNWDSGSGTTRFGTGNASEAAEISALGYALFNGNVKGKTLCATGSDPQNSAFNMDYSPTGDGAAWGRLLSVSANGSNVAPDMLLICLSGDGSSYHEFLRYRAASHTINITGDMNGGGNIKFNAGTFLGCGVKDANSAANGGFTMSGSSMYCDVQGADPATIADIHFRVFNQGASTIIDAFTIGSNGDAHVYGTLSAGTKSFRIPHPLDKKKMLTHGSLEGPEHGVFYRGEVKCSKGQATVTLPDYFEALTEKEGRTVLLTQIDDDSIDFAMLTATRISKGKFTIKSSEEDATVYWEVKATRASTPIAVVSEKEKAA